MFDLPNPWTEVHSVRRVSALDCSDVLKGGRELRSAILPPVAVRSSLLLLGEAPIDAVVNSQGCCGLIDDWLVCSAMRLQRCMSDPADHVGVQPRVTLILCALIARDPGMGTSIVLDRFG